MGGVFWAQAGGWGPAEAHLAVMGSMLKMRQEVKSARPAMSAAEMLHGTLGRQAYTCKGHVCDRRDSVEQAGLER